VRRDDSRQSLLLGSRRFGTARRWNARLRPVTVSRASEGARKPLAFRFANARSQSSNCSNAPRPLPPFDATSTKSSYSEPCSRFHDRSLLPGLRRPAYLGAPAGVRSGRFDQSLVLSQTPPSAFSEKHVSSRQQSDRPPQARSLRRLRSTPGAKRGHEGRAEHPVHQAPARERRQHEPSPRRRAWPSSAYFPRA